MDKIEVIEVVMWIFLILTAIIFPMYIISSVLEYNEAKSSKFVTIDQINILQENTLVKTKIHIDNIIKKWKSCTKTCTTHYIYTISDNTGTMLAETTIYLQGEAIVYGRIKQMDNRLNYIYIEGTINE